MDQPFADLIQLYRTASARERAGRGASRRLAAAADALGDLRPADLAMAGLDQATIIALVAQLDAAATDSSPGRLPSARFQLAKAVATRLQAEGSPLGSATAGPLRDITVEVLTLAGES